MVLMSLMSLAGLLGTVEVVVDASTLVVEVVKVDGDVGVDMVDARDATRFRSVRPRALTLRRGDADADADAGANAEAQSIIPTSRLR